MAKTKIDPRRARLIKLIHVARRELQMLDEDYRSMLAAMPALGGKTSSADLGIKGLELVMDAMKARGFKVKIKPGKAPAPRAQGIPLADDPQSKLIRHLWLELHTAGAVRDPSERALASYVCRIAKIEALQWLDNRQASIVIETLKKWLDRTITPAMDKNKELDAR